MPPGAIILVFLASFSAIAGCGQADQRFTDRSTPKKAVLALMSAIQNRDVAELRKSYSKDANTQYIDAMAQLLESSAKLQKAVAERLDRERARQIDGAINPIEQDAVRYDEAKETIDGETATVTAADGQVIRLKKEDGVWKIVSESAQGGDAETQRAAAVLKDLAAAYARIAADIAAGKYASKDKDDTVKAIRADLTAAKQGILAGTGRI